MEFEALYNTYPVIESERVILKKIEEKDLDEFFEIHSSEAVYRYIPGKARTNISTVKNMIGHYERDFNKKKMVFLGIYVKEPQEKLAGIAEIFDIDKKVESATIGYRLHEKYWGKGLAAESVKAMTEFLIGKIKVNRLQAYVMTGNTKSVEVLKRNEFIHEGTLRQSQIWKDKGLVDLELYSILKEDTL